MDTTLSPFTQEHKSKYNFESFCTRVLIKKKVKECGCDFESFCIQVLKTLLTLSHLHALEI